MSFKRKSSSENLTSSVNKVTKSKVLGLRENRENVNTSNIIKSPIKSLPNELLEIDFSQFQICTVKEIIEQKVGEVILKLERKSDKTVGQVLIQRPWSFCIVEEGDTVSVKGKRDDDLKQFTVSATSGYFVTNADLLVSSSILASSLFCERKTMLQQQFTGVNSSNVVMTVGSLVHSLFQESLTFAADIGLAPNYESLINDIMQRDQYLKMCYGFNWDVSEIKSKLKNFVNRIDDFLRDYIFPESRKGAWTIDEVVDIEESVWCPSMGLKGKIDVTVKLNNRNKTSLFPLELKTGRARLSNEHRAQVSLYIMMMRELGLQIPSGLLLYLVDNKMEEVSASDNEIRDLIILRNQLSHHMRKQPTKDIIWNNKMYNIYDFPDPINRVSICEKCEYRVACTSYLRTDPSLNHPLIEMSKETLSHLTDADFNYFFKWMEMIKVESDHIRQERALDKLWTETPAQRHESGNTLIDLRLGKVNFEDDSYFCEFEVHGQYEVQDFNFMVGDLAYLGSEKRIAIAMGEVTQIFPKKVVVVFDSDLRKKCADISLILDKYESQMSSTIFNQSNLAALLDNDVASNRLRKIIIEKPSPNLQPIKTFNPLAKQILRNLNCDQQNAVEKALSCDSFMLIRGNPGTGKTQTLSALIEILALYGKSVLFTSYTHSAVDNLLLRLKTKNVPFMRIGSSRRVAPALFENTESALTAGCRTIEELDSVYKKHRVVAATCYGVSHSIIWREPFDVCIVDEATQISQPCILRALLAAKTFILVGDPDQLPPVIKSQQAKQMGANETLFAHLQAPSNTVSLRLNYRMNQKLTDLANQLTYKGELKCATDAVCTRTITIKQHDSTDGDKQYAWTEKVLSNEMEDSIVIIDTGDTSHANRETFDKEQYKQWYGKIRCADSQKLYHYINFVEAGVISLIVNKLISAGIDAKEIGVIVPYMAQVEFLRNLYHELADFKGIDINTVDQFQGKDKEVIIYGCTKTNRGTSIISSNDILNDHCRLNVATTRAKYKLVFIGDVATVQEHAPFAKLFNILKIDTTKTQQQTQEVQQVAMKTLEKMFTS